jgi:hypothetical protein
MADKIKLSEIRAKFPQYNDLSDDDLLIGVRKTFYPDIPMGEFAQRVDYDTNKSNPTEGMSGLDKFRAGVGKAIVDTGRGIGQMVGAVSRDEVAESRERDKALMDTGAGLAGNIGGNVGTFLLPGGALAGAGRLAGAAGMARTGAALSNAGRAALMPQNIRTAAGVGAGMGAVQPSTSTSETMMNAGVGAAAGAVPNALSRVLAPQTRPEVAALMREGVSPTPGQIMGGRAAVLEEKLASVPLIGDAITMGKRGAVEDLNRAVYNRALGPVGATYQGPAGREGVASVSRELGNQYDDVLSRVNFAPDAQYVNDLAAALNRGTATLPEQQARQLERVFDSQVMGKVAGPADGETFKSAQSELRRFGRGYGSDPSMDTRELGARTNELAQALRGALGRSNPAEAGALDAIDSGYRNYALIRDAAARAGSKEGVFSPEALAAAVRGADDSVKKGNYARGTANMQDLSEAALNVLGAKYPDSGTIGRGLVAGGVAGAGALLEPTALMVGGAASLPYLPYGRQLAAALLAGQRPQAIQNMAPAVRALTVPATAGALQAQN